MMSGGYTDRPEWIQIMDALYSRRVPFFFMIDFDSQEPLVIPLDELESTGIRYSIHAPVTGKAPKSIPFAPQPLSFEKYEEGFRKVMQHIQAGDTYLLNYCQSTFIGNDVDLSEVFEYAKAPYKLIVPGKFVVFSPESFVTIEDDKISTFPMKGTINANIQNAEKLLLEDIKEQEEHATVVDLLRNDLSIVATNVEVEQYRYLTTIHAENKSLLQCSSSISGTLREQFIDRPGSIFNELLPAGSITGAPKRKTVDIIHEVESTPRNFYTGVFGVYDGSVIQSAVMIRFIEKTGEGYFYKSGGGITYRSNAESEYKELLDKIYVPFS